MDIQVWFKYMVLFLVAIHFLILVISPPIFRSVSVRYHLWRICFLENGRQICNLAKTLHYTPEEINGFFAHNHHEKTRRFGSNDHFSFLYKWVMVVGKPMAGKIHLPWDVLPSQTEVHWSPRTPRPSPVATRSPTDSAGCGPCFHRDEMGMSGYLPFQFN